MVDGESEMCVCMCVAYGTDARFLDGNGFCIFIFFY